MGVVHMLLTETTTGAHASGVVPMQAVHCRLRLGASLAEVVHMSFNRQVGLHFGLEDGLKE